MPGIEAQGVDSARHDAKIAKAGLREISPQCLGRDHREPRLVMELAQVREDRALEPADAIVAAVAMKIGAKVGTHRKPQRGGGLHRRPAERAFGHDVHEVRPSLAP